MTHDFFYLYAFLFGFEVTFVTRKHPYSTIHIILSVISEAFHAHFKVC